MDLVEMDRAYGDLVSRARPVDQAVLRRDLFPEIVRRTSERDSGEGHTEPCTPDEMRSLERQELLKVDETDGWMQFGALDVEAQSIPVKLRVCAPRFRPGIPWRIVVPQSSADGLEIADELQAVLPLGNLNAATLIRRYEEQYGKGRSSSYLLKPIRAYQYNEFNSNTIHEVIVGALFGVRVFYNLKHRTLASLAQGL